MQRLAKAISNSGICSRREAEKLILAGEVKLDGQTIISPAINVNDQNVIEVSGKIINIRPRARLWAYYKPIGLITTHKDTHGRQTVFENLPNLPRVISIGRLDLNSEGLLLLTNNGDLARKFELPSNKFERTYKVRAYGDITNIMHYQESVIATESVEYPPVIASAAKQSQASKVMPREIATLYTKAPSRNDRVTHQPLVINKICYRPKSIKLIKAGRTNSWFEVALTEGKNREIRKIFEYFGLQVNKLIRIKYGSFLLGSLKPGEYREQAFHTFKDLC
jgi:23S rRNA pseudouridine2605 synthase